MKGPSEVMARGQCGLAVQSTQRSPGSATEQLCDVGSFMQLLCASVSLSTSDLYACFPYFPPPNVA